MNISLEDNTTKLINHWYYNDIGDFFMKEKVIDESHELDLESSVNKFLQELEGDVIDIKYQVSVALYRDEQIFCFSAMIIYS